MQAKRPRPRSSSGVWNLDFSPDGAPNAGGSLSGSLNVWNATTGELLFNPGKPESARMPSARTEQSWPR